MIGVGVSPSLFEGLGIVSTEEVLYWYQGRPITRSVIHVLVRYRIARKAGLTVPPCSNGNTYCITA